MRMRIILCAVLGVYSVAMGVYAVSEIYTVYGGCGAGCFKGESAFAGGAGSSGGTRQVNVKYRESGPNGFGADPNKISGALGTAMNNWNTRTDGTSTSPYHFAPAQGAAASSANIEIIMVDEIKGAPSSACMQLNTWKDASGAIAGGRLYVKRSAFNNATQTQVAEMIQHELGHFIGLADFYGNADQCQTTMAQAKDDCKGLKGSREIAQDDVANVKKYVAGSSECKKPRESTPIIGDTGGGYTDPNPSPYYYPRTCYYFYDAVDIYRCPYGGVDGCFYDHTVYYLTDVWCF